MGKSIITGSLVTYNNRLSDIDNVLLSIENSTVEIVLIILDNSSNDKLQAHLQNKNCVYIKAESNLGFGRGHNVCFERANQLNSEYHFIINPDVYFDDYIVKSIVDKFINQDDIAVIMPKIVYPDNKTQYLCKLIPSPADLILRRFFPFGKKKHDYKYELNFVPDNIEFEPPMVSGCFLGVKTNFLIKIKGFDDRFFMYLEDVDIIRRLSKHGKIIYYPSVIVTHKYEKSSYKNLKLLSYHMISAIKYFNKWGWFFDSERRKVNNSIKKEFQL
jgi:GT2 family glycosyltransferase